MTAGRAVRDEYAAAAPRYDERWAEYLAETTRRTLARVVLGPGERLLDVGCGTGVMLRGAAARFPDGVYVGIDLAPEMLHAARARGTPPNLIAADTAGLPVDDATSDVVVTASSLHFWSDPAAGVCEIARVLRPGGQLVLTDWCSDFLTGRLIDRWLRWTGRASYHHVFGSAECARLLAGSGFDVGGVERYRVGVIWGLMTLSATLAARPGEPQR